MTADDTELHRVIAEAFAAQVDRGEVDVVAGADGIGVEIQADQWTLAIEGPPPSVAYLAIDEEPEGVEAMAEALEGVVEPDELVAMRSLDRRLNGALRMALRESGDMLSMELASLLAEGA